MRTYHSMLRLLTEKYNLIFFPQICIPRFQYGLTALPAARYHHSSLPNPLASILENSQF
jgi:hypothetical protein